MDAMCSALFCAVNLLATPVVSKSDATLCFDKECYPVLVGKETPSGDYGLTLTSVSDTSYGGDVLVFKSTDKAIYAVHRIGRGKPEEKRYIRIKSDNPEDRVITSGCINVDDVLYTRLKSFSKLKIVN